MDIIRNGLGINLVADVINILSKKEKEFIANYTSKMTK